jgi:hypothetical protein
MELFIGTFVIFLLSALGLMLGQFFGRDPVGGGCGSKAQCTKSDHCSLKCVFRRRKHIHGEEQ